MDFSKLEFITQKFFVNSKVLNINNVNIGLINKTYIIEHLYDGQKSKFVLQSLSNIFDSHEKINDNHILITDHIKKKAKEIYFNFYYKRWEVPNLIKCKFNNLYIFPFESGFWRAMEYIDKTFSLEILEDEIMAYETGLGLAKFHFICSDIDCSLLETSIKNFHNTKYYKDQYLITIKEYNSLKSDVLLNKRIHDLINCLSIHVEYVDLILKCISKKSINSNVIHGDPKLSNFLFDIQYKHVVSLIDLDTVSSGYFLTDLADCIRSICNSAGEDPKNIENVNFDIKTCRNFLEGYFSINNGQIDYSFELLPEFIYLIIFELTIRFFTDFLQSNIYFKIKYETHNLFRSEVQYRLLSSFLMQISDFSKDLKEIGIPSDFTFVSDMQKLV